MTPSPKEIVKAAEVYEAIKHFTYASYSIAHIAEALSLAHQEGFSKGVESLTHKLEVAREALEKSDRRILETACAIAKDDFRFAQGMNEALNILRQVAKTALQEIKEGEK